MKIILNSHTHYDHAGGIAALQRASGATVMASPESKKAFENGGPTSDDPQFGFGKAHNDYSAVANVRAVKACETVRPARWPSPRISRPVTRRAAPRGRGALAKASAVSTWCTWTA